MNLVSKYFVSIKEGKFGRIPRHKSKTKAKNHEYQGKHEENIQFSITDDGSSSRQSRMQSLVSPKQEKVNIEPSSFRKHFSSGSQGDVSIGVYELQHVLGVGKQGRVLLAYDTLNDKFVALKVVNAEHLNPTYEKYLQNEIYALRTMNHPNILKLKEVFYDVLPTQNIMKTTKALVMVLDFCSGGEVFKILHHTGSFSEPLARTYFKQLVSAISSCHDHGVYHRDLKLQNLLLDSDFQIKIADFGVCVINSRNDVCNKTCGTRSYMAPEVMSGHPYSGEKADSWSLGIVLFILLAGCPPLNVAASSDWWFRSIQSRQMEKFWHAHERFSPNFPTSARQILGRILVADPDERCSVKDLLTDPWMSGVTVEENQLKVEMSRRLRITQVLQNEVSNENKEF